MKERAQDDDQEHETLCATIASADEIPRLSLRTEFNRVPQTRPSKFLLFHSLRRSLRCLSLGRKIKRNTLWL